VSDERRTLVLLRHAKSAYPTGVGDHGRPLAPRGIREAELAGRWLTSADALGAPVSAVLCSTASRTRETLALTGIDAPVVYLDELYGASPGEVIHEINMVTDRFDAEVATLLVVGHEPAMAQVALGLAGPEGTDSTAAEDISMKFPTSALAVLRIGGAWADVTLGSAALTAFHVPR
jgi:phosphohistidine phosphatase